MKRSAYLQDAYIFRNISLILNDRKILTRGKLFGLRFGFIYLTVISNPFSENIEKLLPEFSLLFQENIH